MGKPGKKRIMVQLWGVIAKAIDRDFKALHIKRDSYLNALFKSEIENLAGEVTFRNSDAVRERIQSRKLPNRVKLTLELDADLVSRIDEVLQERNIPRDSFVNRVLFFLIAKKPHLDALGIEYERRSQASAKPLEDAWGYLRDPFFHIRSLNDDRFYTLAHFPDCPLSQSLPNLFALNTAVSDQDWEMMNISADDLLAELGMISDMEVGHATN